mmetsp:Transcript_62071/g.113957  ORF Transcript_62071/g.113957 Transcript_62071/m.113957 type:complete len:704 (-) Transcript_62071:54-2165(-)
MSVVLCLLVLAAAPATVAGRSEQESYSADQGMANPIRRIVTMLQSMQKKVVAEGEAEEKLYDKFMCYCKNGEADLDKSIALAKEKIPEVKSKIDAATAQLAQTKATLKDSQASKIDAQDTMAKATALREKEAATYSKESSDYKTNIKALAEASTLISKGMAGAFLQTRSAAAIRKLAIDGPNMNDVDRQTLLAFLSDKQGSQYVPKSGEIVGILDQLKDEMSASLEDIMAAEKSAIATYDGVIAAKTKEIAALQELIERSQTSVGDLGMEIEMMKNDLSDTDAALLDDIKFLEGMTENCATKKSEWAEIVKMRAQEQVALAETIKVLNDDDALELFKKTLPSASLLQTEVSSKAVRAKALAVLARAKGSSNPDVLSLNFVELALKGKGGFEKVIKLIDDMVALLSKEQSDDDTEKAFCLKQFDSVEDDMKVTKQKISDLEVKMDDTSESIEALKAEIATLVEGVAALDASVAEATEQRKEEHAAYLELMSGDAAAKELIAWAKNRLNKFYNPSVYQAPPKRELAAAFVQVAAHRQTRHEAAPAPPPETFKAYSKMSGASSGVIKMLDTIIGELNKEMQTAGVDEESAQKQYEATMTEAGDKRAQDSALIAEKTGAKAEYETELGSAKGDKTSATQELTALVKYEANMHSQCDWLLKYFDVRKEARTGEVESLEKAKAILSGADYSFIQSHVADARRSQKLLRR